MDAIELIKRWEGLELLPYTCPAGHATVGYGHLLHRGPVTSADVARFIGFGPDQAEALLRADIAPVARAVDALAPDIADHERAALTSFAFNLGSASLKRSTLLKKLLAGDRAGAAAEFGRWINVNGVPSEGLRNRRADEARVFRGES